MLQQIPLTPDEALHLRTIYTARFRTLCGAYAFLLFIGLVRVWLPWSVRDTAHPSKIVEKGVDYEVFGHQLTSLEMFYLLLVLFGGLIVGSGIAIFLRKVYPFRKDASHGMKEVVPYIIVRKSEFPLVNKFFLSFNDPRFMHYEVDEATYYSFSEGDVVNIYRGVYSKYVFTKDGRFTLM